MADQQLQPVTDHTTPFSAPWLASLRRALGSINGKPSLMEGAAVSPTQLKAISSAIEATSKRLAPAERNAILAELAALQAPFPQQDQSPANASLRAQAYVLAVQEFPLWVLAKARETILSGKTAIDQRFMPTPPQLATVYFSLVEPARKELRDLIDIRTAATPDEPKKLDLPEEREAFVKQTLDAAGLGKLNDEKDQALRARVNAALAKANDTMFERDCRAAGVDPARGVSPQLLRNLGQV